MFISKRDLEGLQVRLVALEREVSELKYENKIYRTSANSLPFCFWGNPAERAYTVKEIVEQLLIFFHLEIEVPAEQKVSLKQSFKKE